MGFYVKSLPKKKSTPKWKVQYISWKKSETVLSQAKKPKKERDIPRRRWASLGFYEGLTLAEAKARAKQLNQLEKVKRHEEAVLELERKYADERKLFYGMMPEEFIKEFEERFIRKEDSWTQSGKRRSRASHRWRAAQKMIRAIALEPKDWFFHQDKFYDYFYSNALSIRYAYSILSLVNLWGFFYCRKLAQPFLQVAKPRGYERQRIVDANNEKRNKNYYGSKPLIPEVLEQRKPFLNLPNYNWLALSVWFGLRPREIDDLRRQNYRVQEIPGGLVILWVFQTKIISVPKELRWKPIPVLFSEQKELLGIIEHGEIKRPLNKTMKLHFGEDITLYGGRKGFVDLMLARKQSFENISVWMGHSTLGRTWRHYKHAQKFHLDWDEVS